MASMSVTKRLRVHKHRNTKATSGTSSGKSKALSSTTQTAAVYLGPLLPAGYSSYFAVRRAGRYYGLRVECPVCHTHAPEECDYGLRRYFPRSQIFMGAGP